MEQLFQNIPEHNINIQKAGCNYICWAGIYQEITGHKLLPEVINASYIGSNRAIISSDNKNLDGKPFMTKECFIYSGSGIIGIISGFTGVSVYMKQVKKGELFTHRLAYITRTTNGGKFVGHFVRVTKTTDDVTHDPWKGTKEWNYGSKTAAIGKIDSYRYIYARLL